MPELTAQYQSIIKSLNYINRGDAREFSIVWVSRYKARVVYGESIITSIVVDAPDTLDDAVADYLIAYAGRLAEIRFSQYFKYGTYTH